MDSSTKCADCGSNRRRGKLLRCLHALCVACLESHLTSANEVLCPACGKSTPACQSGKSQLLHLPDCPFSLPAANLRSASPAPYCDECVADAEAVEGCEDCGSNLCRQHATTHSISRSTHKHKLLPLPAKSSGIVTEKSPQACASPASPHRYCLIHSSHAVRRHCSTCDVMLCELCQASGHLEHTLTPLEDASEKVKRSLRAKLQQDGYHDKDDVITVSRALESVEGAIKDLYQNTEQVSTQVVAYIDELIKKLEDRQAKLLDDLDRLRNAKLIPLEEQKIRLEVGVTSQNRISAMLESYSHPYDVVRAGPWLGEAAEELVVTFQKDLKPCKYSHFQLHRSRGHTSARGQVGTIIDTCDVDYSASSLSFPCQVAVNSPFTITLDARNVSHKRLQLEVTLSELITAFVEPVGEPAVAVSLAPERTGTCLVAQYVPQVSGRLKPFVRFANGRIVDGNQRRTVLVLPQQNMFNPDSCDRGILLSDDKMTATAKVHATPYGAMVDATAYGAMLYHNGKANIRLQLSELNKYRGVALGLEQVVSSQVRPERPFYGWKSLRSAGRLPPDGLGQPWHHGDIITLSLDLEKSTLTGLHERSKMSCVQKLALADGASFYLKVVTDITVGVTILPE